MTSIFNRLTGNSPEPIKNYLGEKFANAVGIEHKGDQLTPVEKNTILASQKPLEMIKEQTYIMDVVGATLRKEKWKKSSAHPEKIDEALLKKVNHIYAGILGELSKTHGDRGPNLENAMRKVGESLQGIRGGKEFLKVAKEVANPPQTASVKDKKEKKVVTGETEAESVKPAAQKKDKSKRLSMVVNQSMAKEAGIAVGKPNITPADQKGVQDLQKTINELDPNLKRDLIGSVTDLIKGNVGKNSQAAFGKLLSKASDDLWRQADKYTFKHIKADGSEITTIPRPAASNPSIKSQNAKALINEVASHAGGISDNPLPENTDNHDKFTAHTLSSIVGEHRPDTTGKVGDPPKLNETLIAKGIRSYSQDLVTGEITGLVIRKNFNQYEGPITTKAHTDNLEMTRTFDERNRHTIIEYTLPHTLISKTSRQELGSIDFHCRIELDENFEAIDLTTRASEFKPKP